MAIQTLDRPASGTPTSQELRQPRKKMTAGKVAAARSAKLGIVASGCSPRALAATPGLCSVPIAPELGTVSSRLPARTMPKTTAPKTSSHVADGRILLDTATLLATEGSA